MDADHSPIIVIVRHAEGVHNVGHWDVNDPGLTTAGLQQCAELSDKCPYVPDAVISSPLRRTIMTALLGFGKHFATQDLKITLVPELREIPPGSPCNNGSSDSVLEAEFGNQLIDTSRISDPTWYQSNGETASRHYEERARQARVIIRTIAQAVNSKVSYVPVIVVVTHGNIWKFLTGDHKRKTTYYRNAEWRAYRFKAFEVTDHASTAELKVYDPAVL
ncbi:histidine phosphatase superfamily [Hypoxylon sp. NC1633]|nr:histidine phosphatase superfamily [Hypoxylon sp. NC1633]